MSYYPILKAPNCKGWVVLSNFSPNNWEIINPKTQFVNLTWMSNGSWNTKIIDDLKPGDCKKFTDSDFFNIVPSGSLTLLSLSEKILPKKSDGLPKIESYRTGIPAWRATLGLSTKYTETSYQGELNPFPPKASLLTYGPFLQFAKKDIKNYIILLNLESTPMQRPTTLEVYDGTGNKCRGKFTVESNNCSSIQLDDLGFGPNDLPVHFCREMTAIPLYLSLTTDKKYISLEHTHPPGSLVVHGKRWLAQKILKDNWFNRIK